MLLRRTHWTLLGLAGLGSGYALDTQRNETQCRRTTVAIVGAGVAGITAAQALHNASISEFIIVDGNDYIGGRLVSAEFGQKDDGSPWTIELGGNWIHGVGGKFENPFWWQAKKYDLQSSNQDFDSLLSYNESGPIDIEDVFEAFEGAVKTARVQAGSMLQRNIQDQTARAGLAVAGWKPERNDMVAQFVEWVEWDFTNAVDPMQNSLIFGVAGENITYGLFGEDEPLVIDPRGYDAVVKGEASTFLSPIDPRLMLNTAVSRISRSKKGVTLTNKDGSCISAAYVINTVSLGVLQHNTIQNSPKLPDWKVAAIQSFGMATYTKIYLQFNNTWWPEDVEFLGYASPNSRGYYPYFQSLSHPNFLPGSHIMFVTVTDEQAYRVERQSDSKTQAEIMEVLGEMFPNITIPEPIAFTYPRWTLEPWARGSYSF